jgi:hypothetical protein
VRRQRQRFGVGSTGEPADLGPLAPITTSRGFVRVPTFDVRQYVQQTLITLAVGFGVGVGVGALFGNVLTKMNLRLPTAGRLIQNARGSRRTTARRRSRGRPFAAPVTDDLDITLDGAALSVSVRSGIVTAGGARHGSVYDLGTTFRAIPKGGEVRDFTTLAGAVKHVLRGGMR